jgi:hypothetical protein
VRYTSVDGGQVRRWHPRALIFLDNENRKHGSPKNRSVEHRPRACLSWIDKARARRACYSLYGTGIFYALNLFFSFFLFLIGPSLMDWFLNREARQRWRILRIRSHRVTSPASLKGFTTPQFQLCLVLSSIFFFDSGISMQSFNTASCSPTRFPCFQASMALCRKAWCHPLKGGRGAFRRHEFRSGAYAGLACKPLTG